MTSEHSLNLDFAISYWHLVDVVWLLVFLVFYYWGGDSVDAQMAFAGFFCSINNNKGKSKNIISQGANIIK